MIATESEIVTVPYKPRLWAKGLHQSFKRWAVLVIHRRGGKTTGILNHHQRAAMDDRWESARLRHLMPSMTEADIKPLLNRRTYWHVMPSYHQAKLTGAWDILQEIARPIPGVKPNQADLSMTYPNGNKLQLVGANEPDNLRGPGLSGLSLDEYSQIPPNAFGEVLSKALADHLGYCIFSGTIKGKDHLYDSFESAKHDPNWFSLWQNVDVSLQTESGATIKMLQQAMTDERELVRKGLMTQAEFDQEWYLSPEAAIKGAFYVDQMRIVREQNQICHVPYNPALPVDTDWDIGVDATAVWFSQSAYSGTVHLIDYYEDVGGGIELAIKALKGQLDESIPENKASNSRRSRYTYGKHWGPHDIRTRETFSAKSRINMAAGLGIKFDVTPMLELTEGIDAARFLIPQCWFEEEYTKDGLEALRHYRRTYNQKLNVFTETPVHDTYSHGADAFRGLAVRYRLPVIEKHKQQQKRRLTHRAGSWMGV